MKCKSKCRDGRPCPRPAVLKGYCIIHFKKEIIDKNLLKKKNKCPKGKTRSKKTGKCVTKPKKKRSPTKRWKW